MSNFCLSRHSPRPLWNIKFNGVDGKEYHVSVGIRPDLYGIKEYYTTLTGDNESQ